MVFRSAISALFPMPKPILAPAIERDLEKVCATRMLSYFFVSGIALSVPKSTYASSTMITLSGFDAAMRSISLTSGAMPVGALGFAIAIFMPIPI